MKKHFKFIVLTASMIGSIEASYTDFGFIQAKGGGMNVRLNSNLSAKVTFKLKNDVAMTMIPIQHGRMY